MDDDDQFNPEMFVEEHFINITPAVIDEYINEDDNDVDETQNEPNTNNYTPHTQQVSLPIDNGIENDVESEHQLPQKFYKLIALCPCDPKCDINEFKGLARSFYKMSETDRRNVVMGILIPLT